LALILGDFLAIDFSYTHVTDEIIMTDYAPVKGLYIRENYKYIVRREEGELRMNRLKEG